jgi:transcriptional regulator with XRE-family HTH domain
MKAATAIGWNLRRLRVARRLSQESLAVDADVDVSYISRLENGLENPTIGLLERTAQALDVEFWELVKKPDKKDKPPKPLPSGRRRKTG